MRVPGLIGPTYVNRSVAVDVEETVNLYPEIIDGGAAGKAKIVFHGTPGLTVFAQTGSGPVRGLWAADGRCFAVSGTRFVEIFPNGTVSVRASVTSGPGPVTISSNGEAGHQLLIVSPPTAYVYDTLNDIWTNLTATLGADYPVAMGAFLDGYFLLLKSRSNEFRISGLEDGLTWDSLDVAQRSQSTDEVRTMAVSHREIWLLGSRSTEVWYDTGDADFPFAPIVGATLDVGIAAPWTAVVLDNTLFWVGADSRGVGIVYRANGYTPQRISTHALETALTRIGRLDDLYAYAYQEDGHTYYLLYDNALRLPKTWVYDCATQLWHERAHWDEALMRWRPHVGRCHAWAFNRHLIGDRASGIVYAQSLDVYDEELSTAVFPFTLPVPAPDPVAPPVAPSGYTAPTATGAGTGGTLIDATLGSAYYGLPGVTSYYRVVAVFEDTKESSALTLGPFTTDASADNVHKRVNIVWDTYPIADQSGKTPTAIRIYRSSTADFSAHVQQCVLTSYPLPEAPSNFHKIDAMSSGTGTTYRYAVSQYYYLVGEGPKTSDLVVDSGDPPNVTLDWWEDVLSDLGRTGEMQQCLYGRTTTATALESGWFGWRTDTGAYPEVSGPWSPVTPGADLPIDAVSFYDQWPGKQDEANNPWVTVIG